MAESDYEGIDSFDTPKVAQVGDSSSTFFDNSFKPLVNRTTYLKARVDALTPDAKASVRLGTTADHALSGLADIDGETPVANDRVAALAQADQTQNGLYLAAAGAWTRTTDADGDPEISPGLSVYIEEGTTRGETVWRVTNTGAITIGATNITWEQSTSTSDKAKLDAATTNASSDTLVIRDGSGVIANEHLALGTNLTPGLRIQNSTAAAAGAQQYSGAIQLTGHGWETDAGGLDNTCHWYAQVRPVEGTSEPSNELHFLSNTGGAGVLDQLILRNYVGVPGVTEIAAGAGRWLAGTSDTALYFVAPTASFLAETGAATLEFRGINSITFRGNTANFKHGSDNVARLTATWGGTGVASTIALGQDSAVTIQHTTRTSDAATVGLTIGSQAPNAGATGGNRTPGTLALVVPAAVGGGTEGTLSVQLANVESLSLQGGAQTTAVWKGAAAATVRTDVLHATGASSCTWGAGVTSVTYDQAQHASGAGAPWVIRAQQSFAGSAGPTLTIGGGYGGTPGTQLAGNTIVDLGQPVANATALLDIRDNAASIMSVKRSTATMSLVSFAASAQFSAATTLEFIATNSYIVFSSTNSGVAPALYYWRGTSNTVARTDSMTYNGACSMQWAATVTSVAYNQADVTGASATGAVTNHQAQNATGTTSTGGAWKARSGTGTTAPGNLVLGLGAIDVVTLKPGLTLGTQLQFAPFTGDSTCSIGFASTAGTSTALWIAGQDNTASGAGSVTVIGGAATGAGATAGSVEIRGGPGGQAGGGVSGDVTIAGGNGVTLGTGGNVNVTAGAKAGASTNGYVSINMNGGTSRFKVDDVGIGFFATAPVAKQTIVGARNNPEGALAALLTGLATYGFITDSTTAS